MKIKNNVCDYYNGDKVLVKLEDGSEVIVKSNEVK